jgi:hypothetical protein
MELDLLVVSHENTVEFAMRRSDFAALTIKTSTMGEMKINVYIKLAGDWEKNHLPQDI